MREACVARRGRRSLAQRESPAESMLWPKGRQAAGGGHRECVVEAAALLAETAITIPIHALCLRCMWL